MGLFDIFRKKKDDYKVEQNHTHIEEIPTSFENANNVNSYSDIIPNEIIEKIMKINNIKYINDLLIRRMEKHPKLVDLLLSGSIPKDIVSSLSYTEKLDYLPFDEEKLKFIEFFDLDEETQKLVSLLKNIISENDIDDSYQKCYVDLNKNFETIDFHNEIDSFIPDIKINLGNEILTKLPIFSSFILCFPSSEHKIVTHDFENFITGNIELNEKVVIQMLYSTFCFLDESVIDKISNCKIVISEDIKIDGQIKNDIDYNLVKYNHLIYIIENSSLDSELKEKLLYKIKNMYTDNKHYLDVEINDKIISFLKDLDIEEIKKLTDEFEQNIEKYIQKNIERPAFNINFFIDENFPNLDNMSIDDVISQINWLPENLKLTILQNPRILNKLNISDKLNEEQLKELIYIFSTRLSPTTIDFIKSLNFDIEAFMSDPSNDYKTSFNINPIVDRYGVFDYLNESAIVSVADLLGHDGTWNWEGYKGKNILYTFENFFKKNGDGYHTRALGLLEYKSGEELLEELKMRNQDTIDMKIREIEDGKYIVSGNGLHRFTVLRFHYLLDCMKKEKSKDELKELYKIPVTIDSKTNYMKTYCNYLIKIANPEISSISFYNENEIIVHYNSEDKIINEETLLNLAIESIDMLNGYYLLEVQDFYKKIASFHDFIDKYIPQLLDKFEIKSEESIKL